MHLHLVTIHAMHSPQAVPLAAASLKAFLDARDNRNPPVTVTCAEIFSGTPLDAVAGEILALEPDMVGFPLYVWNRAECCGLAELLRRAAPGLMIIAGGPEATADPEGVLKEAPFDLVVIGEGEFTLAELFDRLAAGVAIDDLPGIARLVHGRAVSVKRPPIPDLGLLTSPYLSGLLDAHIPNGVVWQLSRGCSFGCDFCFDGMGDRKVRRYPLERLEAELDYVLAHRVNQIFVLDSTFNQDVKRAKTLLRLIAKKAPHVHCHFEVRHELLDSEQARLFAGLTCSLQIGLQSADPEVARNVGRAFRRDDFVAKIGMLNETGVIFGFDLIYGLPGDSLARFREGLDFALSLYPNHLDIFPLSVLPGTALAGRATALGMKHLAKPPYTLLETPTFPAADMVRARRLGAACDIFYSRGKAVAWFNGVVATLRLTPVAFLERFVAWLQEQGAGECDESRFGDEAIWRLQREFLTARFTRQRVGRLLPLALDFVDYHYHYAATVMAVPPQLPGRRKPSRADLLRKPLMLAPSSRLATFTYEILDLLETGEPDLRAIAATLQPSGSYAAIYPHDGQVCTESLAEPYFRLLERLDGETPAALLAADLEIAADEAGDFLAFATAEGIVTPVAPLGA
ncbi:MAG: DUF4080 domain-containing protein [Geobacter sp.]|nr:DUF4080 domain-containing protein [Geobacter sp.]